LIILGFAWALLLLPLTLYQHSDDRWRNRACCLYTASLIYDLSNSIVDRDVCCRRSTADAFHSTRKVSGRASDAPISCPKSNFPVLCCHRCILFHIWKHAIDIL
jgi:hypothetical protein